MRKAASHLRLSDLRGLARLGTHGIARLADLVEAMHCTLTRRVGAAPARASGLTGLIYDTVRGLAGVVGGGLDALVQRLPAAAERPSSPEREAVLAALNGVLGDHLAAKNNPLAIPMTLRRDGRSLALDTKALAAAMPRAGSKLVLLVHGLCLNDLQWKRRAQDHGAVLARELGYTPVYLHYNSGLHTSINGRAFAGMLEVLLRQWPQRVEELAIVAHSMGGLVARSACHYGRLAGHAWTRRLRKLAFLGTPHHGAPLERGGNWLQAMLGATPYVAPLARLGKIRSAGITDLRYGNVLDEDWQGRDRFVHALDTRRPAALPKGVDCYAIAATMGRKRNDVRDRFLGDGLVPVRTALGLHDDPGRSLQFPESRQWIGYGMNHVGLLESAEVSERLVRWLGEKPRQRRRPSRTAPGGRTAARGAPLS